MIPNVQQMSEKRNAGQHQAKQAKANPTARQDNWLFHTHHTNPQGEN